MYKSIYCVSFIRYFVDLFCDYNNFEGSYECVCVNGFQRHPKNQRCVDIDECNSESSEGLCNDPYECSNTIGSYKCVCSAGLVQVKDFKCIFEYIFCGSMSEPKWFDSVLFIA